MSHAEEIHRRDAERGRKAQAGLRARIEREVDPDGALSLRERAEQVEAALKEHYQRQAKQGWQARRESEMAQPPAPTEEQQSHVTVTTGRQASGKSGPTIDPAVWEPPEMRAALATHDHARYRHGVPGTAASRRLAAADQRPDRTVPV